MLMDKNTVLKIVNPALAVLMLNQPFSAMLSEVTGWGLFEGLHVVGGVLLVLAAAIHLTLNWRWVTANLLRTVQRRGG